MKLTKKWNLPFPVATVYDAWVASDTVIPPATRMEINPVVGGCYRLIMETPDYRSTNEGEFLVVVPESRLVYTWEWNRDGQVTTIDVRFAPADGGCSLTLVHDGFEHQENADNHAAGWDAYVDGLIKHLS